MPRADKQTLDSLNASAALFLGAAEKRFGVKLDFSEESLVIADDLISIFFKRRRKFSIVAAGFLGAYLGNAVIESVGGRWSSSRIIEKVGVVKGKVNPFAKALKRLENGTRDSFVHFVKGLKYTMTRSVDFARDRDRIAALRERLRSGGWDRILLGRISDSSEDPIVREELADALGRIGAGTIVPDLLSMLSNPETAPYAALALQRIPDERSLAPLLKLLRTSGPDSFLKMQAAMALGAVGKPEAVPDLVALLLDEDELVAHYASMGLSKMRPEFVEDAILGSGVLNSPERCIYGIFVLGETGSVKAVPRLIEFLFCLDEEVKEAAVRAFQVVTDERAFRPLSYLVSDKSSTIRVLSAYALAGFGRERALPYVRKLLNDPVKSARIHAEKLVYWLDNGLVPPRCI